MAHPRTSSSFPTNTSQPVTLDGITYVYNSVTARWETDISSNIDIVTKDTDATYHISNSVVQSVAHKPNEELLTVIEVDSNFIQLKQGIAGLEKELTFWTQELQENINDEAALRQGIGSSITDPATGLSARVLKSGDTMTGNLNVVAPALNNNSGSAVSSAWVRAELQQFPTNIEPSARGASLGTFGRPWRNIYIDGEILPDKTGGTAGTFLTPSGQVISYQNVNIGSPTRAFNTIFAKDGTFSGGTITLGEASLSETSGGGVLIPSGSAVGTDENIIPSNFANSIVDERFALLAGTDTLKANFTVTGTVAAGDPVKLTIGGRITTVNSTNTKEAFIGFAVSSGATNDVIEVILHGPVSGFSSLTSGDYIYISNTGVVSQTNATGSEKIGIATSATEIFLFSTSNADIYALNQEKISFDALSVTNATPSGGGSLVYNSSTGVFTNTPADLSPYATQTYVANSIASLVDGAPGVLDTLNEIADAIADDPNFATTISNAVATKASLNSPTFTGTPRAPAPASTSNDTQIATTAFVKSLAGSQTIEGLTNVTVANLRDGQVLAYDSVNQDFRNVNQTGGTGGNVNFVVDGGTATTVSSDIIIFLDGGSA